MSYQIAIDGPAGAGKSSISKLLASKLGFIYVDTGALYRGLAVIMMDNNIDILNDDLIKLALQDIQVELKYIDNVQHVIVNNIDVTDRLRNEKTSDIASKISSKLFVRSKLDDIQKNIANSNNVIMDGRDIGTVILPNATLKIFLIASAEVRAKRRVLQLEELNEKADYDEILSDIKIRDERDMNRKHSPLTKASDAYEIDSSDMTREEVVDEIIKLFNLKIN